MSKHAKEPPFTAWEIEQYLQPLLVDVISRSRSLQSQATLLASLTRDQQGRVLHWVEVISRTNAELAFQLTRHATTAAQQLNLPEIDDWILRAMNTYDHHGLYAATSALQHIGRYLEERGLRRQSVDLDSVSKILGAYVQGLNGRHLDIAPGDCIWTDTETIYLPSVISEFGDRDKNFAVYKAAAALLWAQTWFGTFAVTAGGELKIKALTRFDDPDHAGALFAALETERLLHRISRELPGMARQMRELIGERSLMPAWQQEVSALQHDEATVDDALLGVRRLYPAEPPQPLCFQPEIFMPAAEKTVRMRIDHEREQLNQILNKLIPEALREQLRQPGKAGEPQPAEEGLQLRVLDKPDAGQASFELSFNGTAFNASPELQDLLLSILQDLGEVPLDYLVAGGSADPAAPRASPVEIPQADDDAESGISYPEWDYRRGHYRQDWCFLREAEVEDGPEEFVATTLAKYSAVLPQLRKSFEALRGEDRWLRRQLNGDEIDIDAVVDAIADSKGGLEPSERLYTRLSRIDRNIAVMLMIDMSGSTKGWVNDAEREALVLLCQALEILGDRYAIYGFSGMTRKRCELYRIKEFDESYTSSIDRRISGISAKDYTRMGVTIRHLNKLLEATPAKTKLLITLSDGKPEDFDGYGGEYGIEDTRQALIESRRLGIHPFCITIDTEAGSYLPHMYGAHNYAVVDDVRALPLRVADVYRRLTH